tara:strand:+ start:291 stop:494 length:204 start_codon:yes stop_codon:yes gene_type:complete
MTLDNKTVLSSLKERVAILTEQLNDLTVQRTKCIGAIEVLTQIEESIEEEKEEEKKNDSEDPEKKSD